MAKDANTETSNSAKIKSVFLGQPMDVHFKSAPAVIKTIYYTALIGTRRGFILNFKNTVMTVRELRKKLKGLSPHMDVVIEKEVDGFTLQIVESAKVKKCNFSEDTGPVLAKVKCLVLSDDI